MTRLFVRERWIAHLPDASEEAAADLVITGWLVPGAAGEIRVVTGDLCLTFATADVVGVEPLSEPGRVSLVVSGGAGLRNVCPRECVAGLLPTGRQPFAFTTRPLVVRAGARGRFAELEEDFLRRGGLLP